MRRWVDLMAALLLVGGAVLSVLDSVLAEAYGAAPLALGLAALLLWHGRRQPLRYLYLVLLLVILRILLQGDERFLPEEITLSDYLIVILGFAASYRLPQDFWRAFLPLFAIFVPLAALLTYLLRSGPELLEKFHAGALSINQTALLLGACLTLALCFLWNSATTPRPVGWRTLLTGFWLGITGILALLQWSTGSRSGLGLAPLVVATMLLWAKRRALQGGLLQVSSRLARTLQRWMPQTSPRAVLWVLLLAGGGLLVGAAAMGLSTVYANKENTVSDLHRLSLLGCYFHSMVSDDKHVIYGMGFTSASQTVCKNIGLIKGTTHAHNIFAQIGADNGFFAMLLVLGLAGWFLRQAFRRAEEHRSSLFFATSCLYVFLLMFLQIEGGWGKVTTLQVLLGLSLGALTMEGSEVRPASPGILIPGRPDRGRKQSGL